MDGSRRARRAVVVALVLVLACTVGAWTTPAEPAAAADPTSPADPTSTADPAGSVDPAAATGRSLAAFRGLGTWVDVYDWSFRYGGSNPAVGPASVDRMAQVGVTTLYLQTTTPRAGVDLLEVDRLRAIIDRAHARGMRVVGWYVPTLVDPGTDLRRLLAMTTVGVDAVGVDIEDLSVSDTNERNHRLLSLSAGLRAALPSMPLSAITLDAVHLDVINRSYWPSFPWAQLAPHYDVFQPMSYWSNRTVASGYRDGYRYVAESMDRIRAHTGRPDLPIHPIGGLASLATTSDLQGMVLAAAERGALGISLYDWAITPDSAWSVLRLSGGDPVGNVDLATGGPGSVVVAGWALDPDAIAPVDVHVYVDGVGRANVRASRPRPDVGAQYPDWGPDHGFEARVEGLTPGPHVVCTFAISVGRGSNTLLRCQTVVVPSGSPWGSVDVVRPGLRSITLDGWAIDPDSAAPTEAHVYVDGVGRANVPAAGFRADLLPAFPGWEGIGAFRAVIPDVAPGPHAVCTFAIDVGPGENRLLDCRTVVVPSDPGGVLDAPVLAGAGALSVGGWAADPDTPGPIEVHVYVDGVGQANLTADRVRPDAAPQAPSLGTAHGFGTVLSGLRPGRRQVCAFAINVGPGSTTVLGCATATIPAGPPLGVLDDVVAGPRSVSMRGWAIDPDLVGAARIHVYIDGVGRANVPADVARPDVGTAFPGWGPDHGFDLRFDGLAPGSHDACAFAVDPLPPYGATLLGCRTVVVPSGSPIGFVDAVTVDAGAPGTVRVQGWTLDPDTALPTEAHVYVDGVGWANVAADAPRPDVAAVFPPWGAARGIDVVLSGVTPGPRAVCTFAIDRVAPGGNVLLRCVEVVVPG